MTKISKNIFSKGLSKDYDSSNVSAYSMIDNINGRLMFNDKGTLDWVEDNGNKISFTISANNGTDPNPYNPIGYTGDGNIKVIFSVSTVETTPGSGLFFSEIGIIGTDSEGNGTYATLFNDSSDPDLLNFNSINQICARFLYENDKIIRVFWVDGVKTTVPKSNPPRVFTFKFNNNFNRNVVTAYTPVSSSVHSINSQADFFPGIIKFVQTISGNLLTGVYQYSYRLITIDGYATPWITPTRKFFVTSDSVSNTNWNVYEMEGSGVNSGKGNEIQIKGIDQRYYRIQVAYLFSESNAQIKESGTFIDVLIDKTTGGNIESFNHVANNGVPVAVDEIAGRFQGIAGAKTLDIKDSTLYYGNLNENVLEVTNAEIENVLANLTIVPTFRDMTSDTNSLGPSTPPITHQNLYNNSTIQKRMFSGSFEDYNLNNDYSNYKGTQVENLFTGYFRGETYRFAIVFYDKLGYPYFAFHLADFKFPEQHSTDYTYERLKLDGSVVNVSASLSQPACPTNDYLYAPITSDPIVLNDPFHVASYSHLRIMGIDVSGIDISGIKDKISGFSIVRTDRDVTIINQGILLPAVIDADVSSRTNPLPVAHQGFANVGGVLTLLGVVNQSGNDGYKIRPNQSLFYSPENDFDISTIPVVQTPDRLKIVGSCYKQPSQVGTVSGYNNGIHHTYADTNASNPTDHKWKSPQIISKWYRSLNLYHNSISNSTIPQYGATASIAYQKILGLAEQAPNYELGLDFHNSASYDTANWPNVEGFGDSGDPYDMWGKNTILYKHTNFGISSACRFNYNSTSSLNQDTQAGSLIANYIRPNLNPYGGVNPSALQLSIFYSTGHFQPVGNPTFTSATNDIYNNIEVYGGDCYLDYLGFLRMYGRYKNPNEDVSYSVVFPYECIINHSLRQASSVQNPIYTDVGARPQYEFSNPGSTAFINGIFIANSGGSKLLEEFNYNDVLTFNELNNFFNSQPIGFQNNNEFPVRWRHTLNKFYGDPIDSWRQFEIDSFKDVNGQHGQITSSSFLFGGIYSFQETAFGKLRTFDRAALESENTTSLTTGVGPALDGVDYISSKSGNQHQWSLVNTGKALYWIDVFNGKSMRFGQDGTTYLSDTNSMHTFFQKQSKFFLNKDNPSNLDGILGSWDSKNREVLFTFKRDEYLVRSNIFVIKSDVLTDVDYYENNETVFVNWTGTNLPTSGLHLPSGNSQNGNNYNTLQYVSLKVGSNPMYVSQINGTTITTLVQIVAGQNYLFSRPTEFDNWEFVQINKSKITPFRSTVVYSEYISAFTQFHSFKPKFSISHNKFLLTQDSDITQRIFYVHGKNPLMANYYGLNYKTSIEVAVNDGSEFSKLFDNLRVAINTIGTTTMDKFIFSTQKQDRFYNVQGDGRVKFLEDNLRLPIRRQDQSDRMRGRFLNMILEFGNNSNKSVKIDNFINHYRVSNRK